MQLLVEFGFSRLSNSLTRTPIVGFAYWKLDLAYEKFSNFTSIRVGYIIRLTVW